MTCSRLWGFSSRHLVSLCFWTGEEDVWVSGLLPEFKPVTLPLPGALAFLGWDLYVVNCGLFVLLNFSGKNWDPE